jgi:serine/threonine-protein kinase HipA
MISECFVHIQLPGSLDVQTAGRFRLDFVEGQPVGRFVYGRRYLADPRAVAFDPVELLLAPGERRTTALGGIFGALRDAAPDAWGRLLIERRLARADLSELDYLLAAPEDRVGALSFSTSPSPATPQDHLPGLDDLVGWMARADAIQADSAGDLSPA